MVHVNELWRKRLEHHVRRNSWSSLPIAQRYAAFRRLVRLRPILKEVNLTDNLIGHGSNIVELDGSVTYVRWEADLYHSHCIKAYQLYRGREKAYWTYVKGATVLMIVGWNG